MGSRQNRGKRRERARTAALLALLALLAALAARERYDLRLLARLGHEPPAAQAPHYRSMLPVHGRVLAQIRRAPPPGLVAFAGDSIVQGWATGTFAAPSVNLGTGGDTMAGLAARLEPETVAAIPVWYVAVGLNDARRRHRPEAIAAAAQQLADTLRPARRLYWQEVLPLAPGAWSEAQEAARQEVNAAIRSQCRALPACTLAAAPPGYAEHAAAWSADALHPNALGYAALTRAACAHLSCLPGSLPPAP
ncbi:GDSL-type esterase/lipase family protein (plasmid) [Roseobacteraceae bacterium NS-SX3]